MSQRPAPLRLRILLALVASVITLGFLEGFARYFIDHLANREQFSKYASLDAYRERVGGDEWWFGLLVPHRYTGYSGAPGLVDGENRHNALGHRGEEVVVPKPSGRFRIACLGASTTYSISVRDYRRSYPAQLETNLRERGYASVEVVNAGIPAWTSYETLINYLLRIQDLEPDLVIVHQAFGDITTRMVWPPEKYDGENRGHFAARPAVLRVPWYARSALARILMVEAGRAVPASAFGGSLYNEAETSHYLEYAQQRMLRTYPTGIFADVTPKQMFDANPPVYFRRNTRNLVAAVRHAGSQVVLMSFAYAPTVHGFFDIEGFAEETDRHNAILLEVAREFEVPFFDLNAVLPGEHEYWAPDGIHVNDAGTQLKAELVTDFLIDNALVR